MLLDYVMILDKTYFLKISTEDDIEKINYAGRQLGSAGAFRPDRSLLRVVCVGSVLFLFWYAFYVPLLLQSSWRRRLS